MCSVENFEILCGVGLQQLNEYLTFHTICRCHRQNGVNLYEHEHIHALVELTLKKEAFKKILARE